MARLDFQDIRFEIEEDRIRLVFLRMFDMYIDRSALEKLGDFEVSEHSIEFQDLSDKELQNKFMPLLDKAFRGLKSVLTKHDAVYIHRNSGIPLIGILYFGIVDRGTNMLEVKPITGCNIDCMFCSVDEGLSSKKTVDFVVEDEYLAEEVRKVIEYKQTSEVKMDIFINTHGEPLLYANMVDLVRMIREIEGVGLISIITNGTLLTKKLADELISVGLNQLNLSLNAVDEGVAKELAGTRGYDVKNVMSIARYVSDKLKLTIAPVWIKGLNDKEIPKIIDFAKEIGAEIGIQNYMVHRRGRKIAKQVGWEEFYIQLDKWEKVSGLALRTNDHTLAKTKQLEKPFRKGDVVKAEILSRGRMRLEMLAAAQGRVISIVGCDKKNGRVKVKILKDKDNVFVGEVV